LPDHYVNEVEHNQHKAVVRRLMTARPPEALPTLAKLLRAYDLTIDTGGGGAGGVNSRRTMSVINENLTKLNEYIYKEWGLCPESVCGPVCIDFLAVASGGRGGDSTPSLLLQQLEAARSSSGSGRGGKDTLVPVQRSTSKRKSPVSMTMKNSDSVDIMDREMKSDEDDEDDDSLTLPFEAFDTTGAFKAVPDIGHSATASSEYFKNHEDVDNNKVRRNCSYSFCCCRCMHVSCDTF